MDAELVVNALLAAVKKRDDRIKEIEALLREASDAFDELAANSFNRDGRIPDVGTFCDQQRDRIDTAMATADREEVG